MALHLYHVEMLLSSIRRDASDIHRFPAFHVVKVPSLLENFGILGSSLSKLEKFKTGSILTGGNILLLEFLSSHSKASDANIGIIASFVYYVKNYTVD